MSLRILFLTNYYPPSNHGWGYMQLCEEVADGLAGKGHEVAVLTSTHLDGPEVHRPYSVHRLLALDPDWNIARPAAWQFFVGRRNRERQAATDLRRLEEEFQPQVIFVWHAIGLPRVLLQAAEVQPGVVTAYYLAGYLPELPEEYVPYWQATAVGRAARLVKSPLARAALAMLHREGKPIPLKYEHVICVSSYVRQRLVDRKLIPEDSVVIHNGVDLDVFAPSRATARLSDSTRISCLVAGRVVPDKGIHTVIDAFALLKGQTASLSLTVLGDGPESYVHELRAKVQANGLQNLITFQAPVPRDEMPRILDSYDILLLPSEYAEPIARSMQEAMAMGLLVIGTTTGGSGELLVHEETGLVFEAGDAQSLAGQLRRVIADAGLATQLAESGQARVRECFSIDHTIDKIETYLADLVQGRG